MIQIDVTKRDAEMPPNLPQKLISLFKIPENHVQTGFSTQDRMLTATFRSNDCHDPLPAYKLPLSVAIPQKQHFYLTINGNFYCIGKSAGVVARCAGALWAWLCNFCCSTFADSQIGRWWIDSGGEVIIFLHEHKSPG